MGYETLLEQIKAVSAWNSLKDIKACMQNKRTYSHSVITMTDKQLASW